MRATGMLRIERSCIALGVVLLVALPTALHGWPTTLRGNLHPDFGSGKPSAVNLQIALDMGKYVNSFAWRGDPLR